MNDDTREELARLVYEIQRHVIDGRELTDSRNLAFADRMLAIVGDSPCFVVGCERSARLCAERSEAHSDRRNCDQPGCQGLACG